MKSPVVITLVVLAASPAFAAESPRGQSGSQPSHQGKDDGTSDTAAAILAARQKAVDDLRAGRAAPYYFAAPQAPAPTSRPSSPNARP